MIDSINKNVANESLKRYFFLVLAFILIILFFHPIIFSNKTFFFRDMHLWFYPMKYFLATSLKNGLIPYWNSNYFSGAPFLSDIQSGVFYPFSILFVLLGFPKSLNVYIILHFLLGFSFFYLFIKELGLSRKSAIITSISYCFGSYTIASINTLNNLSTLIWLPGILWSFTRAKTKDLGSFYFITVLFLCMAIFGGEPQLFILSTGLLLFYGLMSMPGKTTGINIYIKNIFIFMILVLASILIGLIQIGPTYLDYIQSVRMGGISYEEATKHSLDLKMVKHLFFPLSFQSDFATGLATFRDFFPGNGKIPWLLTIYPGFMIAPLALFGLCFNFSKKILIWLAIFIITLILALGYKTPVYYVFYKIFPFFRFPEKFIFLTSFSLLLMAAYGFDRLISILKSQRIGPNLLFSSIALIMVMDLYFAHRNINPLSDSSFYQDYHPDLQPILDDHDTFRVYLDREITATPVLESTIFNHHIRWQMMLTPNLGILHNIYHVSGVPALELKYQYIITEILLKSWPEKINFLRLANVKYIISTQKLDKKPALKGKIQKVNSLVYKIDGYLPRAWMVGQLLPVKKGVMEEILNDSFEPSSSALTNGDIVDRYVKPFFKNVDNISYGKNGRIHIELFTETPRILVLSESAYPGWKVFVNGKEKPVLWLNLLYQGVEIEKGRHEIDFVFRTKYFKHFLLISLTSLTAFFLIWFYYGLSVRKRTKSLQKESHK